MTHKMPVFALLGPTATGKTALAIELCQLFNMEIINCDSRQIYREMNIGTAKPDKEELRAANHHLVDLVSPETEFSAGDWAEMAKSTLLEILARGKLPLIAGGTGFYLHALTHGLGAPIADPSLREKLLERLETSGLHAMVSELIRLDHSAVETIDLRNPRRVIRALEILYSSGLPLSRARSAGDALDLPVNSFLISLPHPELKARIQARVDKMIQDGLENEARELVRQFGKEAPGLQTIGYREWFDYLEGKIDVSEVKARITASTFKYAKRQETWFRKHPGGDFLNPSDKDLIASQIEQIIKG